MITNHNLDYTYSMLDSPQAKFVSSFENLIVALKERPGVEVVITCRCFRKTSWNPLWMRVFQQLKKVGKRVFSTIPHTRNDNCASADICNTAHVLYLKRI